MMVMTILGSRVSKENWSNLEQAFQKGSEKRQAGLEHSYLVHDAKDADIWRILTVWSSRAALDEMRKSTETPLGVLMFRSAHAEPDLSVFDIVQQIDQK
jgi:heme-degrading monooxygenase HmoA